MMDTQRRDANVKFLDWLERRLLLAGRGDAVSFSQNDPSGIFWLGRLAPEAQINGPNSSDRLNRLEPCAIGMRLLPKSPPPWKFDVRFRAHVWVPDKSDWNKTGPVDHTVTIEATDAPEQSFAGAVLEQVLKDVVGVAGMAAEIRVEVTSGPGGRPELLVGVVNTSPVEHKILKDTRLYQVGMAVSGLETDPFTLEALPDSFRYDRRVAAYGVNCGVEETAGGFVTTDTARAEKRRPEFWVKGVPEPDLTFASLEKDPLPALEALLDCLRDWGESVWSESALDERSSLHGWAPEMRAEATTESSKFALEVKRIAAGIELLRSHGKLLAAFKLMNRAMGRVAQRRGYDRWRAFQMGFILANLACIADPESEAGIVDIVWFATGGGKTETYLGVLITAALYDRMRGKSHGVTAWTRFPLRMLSLQQLQRFADAMAAAEMVRREAGIDGASFAVGFLVGEDGTPNRVPVEPREGQIDIDTEDKTHWTPRYKRLQRCPFCDSESIEVDFDRTLFRLDHICTNQACVWPEKALPFHIVDEEIYRFLPTVVVGTLDKAASVGMNGAMRGLMAAPWGVCPKPGHGFTYGPRSDKPHGCLVPGCKQIPSIPDMDVSIFGPSYRLQDELHLLRDSLGAVDAHYEALLDGLQKELTGTRPKILASSATLEGYEAQVDVLYRREGRVFPVPGPSASEGFWTTSSEHLMRRYVAIAPRGLTIEFVIDRMATELQNAVRFLIEDTAAACAAIGVDPSLAEGLIDLYGTDVIYGNTLRDLDAIQRSINSGQVRPSDGKPLHHEVLTGRTEFKNVAEILQRLQNPEPSFDDRVHLITASSMMSHGVDIDRLNVMIMAGLPLDTAGFIQATARVGRTHPGIVFVIHKIGRERDASVFRSFRKFVEQGDRFIEPIPITRKSRRVLDRTIAGLEMARILAVHEKRAGKSLWKLETLRKYLVDNDIKWADERDAIMGYLGIDGTDARLAEDMDEWFENFAHNIAHPSIGMKSGSNASPSGEPMISLRDVEQQIPLYLDRR